MDSSLPNQVPDPVHDRAIPQDVRETDVVFARVRPRASQHDFEPTRVWRLSPLGIELLVSESSTLSESDPVELQIVVEGRRASFDGVVVWRSEDAERLIGVRFLISASLHEHRLGARDERASMRWICSEQHLPRAIAPSPGRFNEFIGFQIRNISSTGMLLSTSINNSFLIPTMRLTLSVNLPMVGEALLKVQIVWMSIGTAGARDIIELGVTVTEMSDYTRKLFGQYLVQFSQDATLDELVTDGFVPNNVAQGITFYALRSEEDYELLLELRRHHSVKRGDSSNHFEKRDDADARIIIGKIGKDLVASAKVRYPTLRSTLACEDVLKWRDDYPRCDELIEVFDIIVKCPAQFEQDAILALFRYICTCCTTDTRQNVLICVDDHPRLFETAGWKMLHAGDTSVLIGNAYSAIQGTATNPIRWNFVWRRSAEYLLRSGVLKPRGVDRVILKTYLALGKVSRAIFSFKQMRSNMRELRVFDHDQ